MIGKFAKVSVFFERRSDGGVRVTCPDVPGFVLSHPNSDLVVEDVPKALAVIIGEIIDQEVTVSYLAPFESLKSNVIQFPKLEAASAHFEYVTVAA